MRVRRSSCHSTRRQRHRGDRHPCASAAGYDRGAREGIDPFDEDPAPGDEGGPALIQVPASAGAPAAPDWLYTQSTDFPGASPCPSSGCTWNSTSWGSWEVNQFQAATNAHVLASRFHDYLEAAPIGFDEASGNFQRTNTSGSGLGGDYVRLEVNDGEVVLDEYAPPYLDAGTSRGSRQRRNMAGWSSTGSAVDICAWVRRTNWNEGHGLDATSCGPADRCR